VSPESAEGFSQWAHPSVAKRLPARDLADPLDERRIALHVEEPALGLVVGPIRYGEDLRLVGLEEHLHVDNF
jgi:hypothetical protein